jgi:hypothetical protein
MPERSQDVLTMALLITAALSVGYVFGLRGFLAKRRLLKMARRFE